MSFSVPALLFFVLQTGADAQISMITELVYSFRYPLAHRSYSQSEPISTFRVVHKEMVLQTFKDATAFSRVATGLM